MEMPPMSAYEGRRFAGRKVLITSADLYMGPAIAERFRAEGALVIEDAGRYDGDPGEPSRIVASAQPLDILVVNLSARVRRAAVSDLTEESWNEMFQRMVHPTMRFVKAAVPAMVARKSGKVIVVTSAAPLRAIDGMSAYSAARGAQNAFVRVVGAETARYNVQVNAIAQNFVYGGYPLDAMDKPGIREQVMRDVPSQRLAEGWEQAELVLFLASQNSNFYSGQVFPFAGGWVTST
jgi:2-keto-3-deoxy-L-fuconate dehydrogenase